MSKAISHRFVVKMLTIYTMVCILLVNFPLSALADGVSVNVTANGLTSLTLSGPTDTFTVGVTSSNAASCQMTSPTTSGIATSANMSIAPGNPFYPAVGGSTIFTVTCDDGTGVTASASATVSLPATPTPTVTADIKANGSDGPVTLNTGDTYTYSWTSANATACQLTSPVTSGIYTSGSSATISAGNPFYPSVGSPITITFTCTDGVTTATDSVIINLASIPPPPSAVTVDIKANGSDGPVTLTSPASYTYTWTSTYATSCQLTSPVTSGISTSGSSATIGTGNPFYPTIGGPITITIVCTDGINNATDSVIVSISAVAPITYTVTPIVINGSSSPRTPQTVNSGNTVSFAFTPNAGYVLESVSVPIGSCGVGGSNSYNPATTITTVTTGAVTSDCTIVAKYSLDSVPPPPPPASVTATLTANPTSLLANATSTLTWSSTGATSCSAPWTASTATSGTQIVTVATTTTYSITCTNGTNSNTANATVTVTSLPPPPPPASTGKITFCMILADENNVIATSSAGLPAGIFSLNLATSTSFGGSIIQSKTWVTSSFSPNKRIILSSGFDADCTTYQNLNLGTYYYSPLSITGSLWDPTQYNDQKTQVVTSLSDFFPYNTNPNSNGQIVLTSSNLDQTLVILQKDNHGLICLAPQITSSLSLTATVGTPFSYILTASSTTATTFSVTSLPSGLSFSTTTNTISGTPTSSGTFNVSLNAVNTCVGGIDSKILVLNVAPAEIPPPPPGGGGGGGGGGAGGPPPISGGHRQGGTIVSVVSNGLECFYLQDYMRIDFQNDPIQVMKLQAFLKSFEGYDSVTINGVFDQATFDAVSAFQIKYRDDILTPWGLTTSTGYVYILTLKKINEIYCQHAFPVNEAQAREIAAFKALLESLRNKGIQVNLTPGGTIVVPEGTSTPAQLPIVGEVSPPPKGQNINSLAAAIFAGPPTLASALGCLYQFLIILIVLYIIASIIADVLYKEEQNVLKKRLAKWIIFSFELAMALVIAFILEEWCLILPLLIALICSIVWVALYKKHDSIKSSFKSWYLVVLARTKSILKK